MFLVAAGSRIVMPSIAGVTITQQPSLEVMLSPKAASSISSCKHTTQSKWFTTTYRAKGVLLCRRSKQGPTAAQWHLIFGRLFDLVVMIVRKDDVARGACDRAFAGSFEVHVEAVGEPKQVHANL